MSKAAISALSGTNTGNETTTTIGTLIHGSTNKATPVGADEFGIWDSVSGLLNRLSLTNLATAIQGLIKGSPSTLYVASDTYANIVANYPAANYPGGTQVRASGYPNPYQRGTIAGYTILTSDGYNWRQQDQGYEFICGSTSYVGRGGAVTGGATPAWTFAGNVNDIDNTMFVTTKTVKVGSRINFWISNPALLTTFHCYANALTGSIPSLSANTALTAFLCYANALTGSIPSLSANTALTTFHCYANALTGSIPSLSANTALTTFYCYTNALTGFSGGTVSALLGDFQAHNNLLTQASIDAILAAFVAAGRNSGTRILNIGGTGNATPSAAGLTDKATLVSRGWTVTTN